MEGPLLSFELLFELSFVCGVPSTVLWCGTAEVHHKAPIQAFTNFFIIPHVVGDSSAGCWEGAGRVACCCACCCARQQTLIHLGPPKKVTQPNSGPLLGNSEKAPTKRHYATGGQVWQTKRDDTTVSSLVTITQKMDFHKPWRFSNPNKELPEWGLLFSVQCVRIHSEIFSLNPAERRISNASTLISKERHRIYEIREFRKRWIFTKHGVFFSRTRAHFFQQKDMKVLERWNFYKTWRFQSTTRHYRRAVHQTRGCSSRYSGESTMKPYFSIPPSGGS